MSINSGMNKEDMVHICSEILLTHKKNEIMLFTTTGMVLEIVILRSKSDRKRQISYRYHLYVEPQKEYKWTYSQSINSVTEVENKLMVQLNSVQFSRSFMSNSLRPHESQHARPPCPSPYPGVHSNSHP